MPEMTDTDLLAEFQRIAAAATPGPWEAIISSEAVRYLGPPVGSHEHGDYVAYTPLREDKEFIAFARNNASRLIELANAFLWVLRKIQNWKGYTPPTDGRDSIREVYGNMHVMEAHAHGYETYIAANQCDDKQGVIARQYVRIGQLETDLAAARTTIATYRSRYGCLSCGEQHPTESMCPPHEVRTTGLAGIDEERKALTRELSAVTPACIERCR